MSATGVSFSNISCSSIRFLYGEFYHLCSGDHIEKDEMDRACSTYGGGQRLYGVLLGKPEGQRPLGRPRHRWEDIKRNFQEMGCGVLTGSSWLKIGTGGGHL